MICFSDYQRKVKICIIALGLLFVCSIGLNVYLYKLLEATKISFGVYVESKEKKAIDSKKLEKALSENADKILSDTQKYESVQKEIKEVELLEAQGVVSKSEAKELKEAKEAEAQSVDVLEFLDKVKD